MSAARPPVARLVDEAEPVVDPRVLAMLASPELRALVRRRWTLSLALTATLFAAYYGFILLVALNGEFLARRVGAVTTLGIPLGAAVIVIAWVLTAIYVVWANRVYDPAVRGLRATLERKEG
jgi:uncharacterized membrane protein (DUF485 family)